MSARAELAAAASTVEGLDVVDYYRQSVRPGTGFVRLAEKTKADNGFGYVDTWDVVVVLPQDLVSAEKFLESVQGQLLAALDAVMYVQTLTPTQIVFDAQSVPGVVVTGAREG
jgi:hypothetical protein